MTAIITSNAGDILFPVSSDASYQQPLLVFDNADTADIVATQGSTLADMLAAIPANASFTLQAVAVEGYTGGDLQARFRAGSYVALGITGNGDATPVSITAGSGVIGLNIRPTTNGTTLKLRLDYQV
jgi:hypothetical protein